MGKYENYPDDIRCYDNVPGSPFYLDPDDGLADEAAEVKFDLEGIMDSKNHETIFQDYDITPFDVLEKLNKTTFGIVAIDAALEDLAEYIARKKRTDMEESF